MVAYQVPDRCRLAERDSLGYREIARNAFG